MSVPMGPCLICMICISQEAQVKKLWKEFIEFINKGNALDLAVGIIIGTAFKDIVNSLVKDIITPPLGLLLGKSNFTNLFLTLSGAKHVTLEAAKEAGAVTMNYGLFINTIISFLLTGISVFAVIRAMNWAKERRKKPAPAQAPKPPTTKTCPYCRSEIALEATRCPHCTSQLPQAEPA